MKRVWKWFIDLFKKRRVMYKDVVKWLDILIPQLENRVDLDDMINYMSGTTIYNNFTIDYYENVLKLLNTDISTLLTDESFYFNKKINGVRMTKNYSIKDSFNTNSEKILKFLDAIKTLFNSDNLKSHQINYEISLFNGRDFASDDFMAISEYGDGTTSLVKMVFEKNFGITYLEKMQEVEIVKLIGCGVPVDMKLKTAFEAYRDMFKNEQLFEKVYKVDIKTMDEMTNTISDVIKKVNEIKTITTKAADYGINDSTYNSLNETIESISKYIKNWSSYVSINHKFLTEFVQMKFDVIDTIVKVLMLASTRNPKTTKMLNSYNFRKGLKIESEKIIKSIV